MQTSLGFRIFFLISFLLVLAQCSNPKKEEVTSADIFKRYSLDEGANVFVVPPGIVSIFLDESQPGNKEIIDILGKVDKLTFLVLPNKGNVKENPYFTKLDMDFNDISFQDLAMINNGKEIIKVKANGDSESVDELIVLVSNYEALFCVSFIGNISMESIVNLTKPENMAAISNLNRLSK